MNVLVETPKREGSGGREYSVMKGPAIREQCKSAFELLSDRSGVHSGEAHLNPEAEGDVNVHVKALPISAQQP